MKHISYREFKADLSENAQKMDYPYIGSFELTPLCNLDCKMCYVHLQDSSVKERVLSGNQWITVMQEAVNHGMISALLTGGEALMHPDFQKIYLFLLHNGVAVRLKSNGILLRKNLEFLQKYPPQFIDVSLYGCNRESYVAVTGHDAFEEVCSGIRAAIDAGLCVRLAITPSKYMQPYWEQVMELAKSFGAAQVKVNSLLCEPHENTGRQKVDFDIPLKENIAIATKKVEMFPLQYQQRKEWRQELENSGKLQVSPVGLPCNAGKTAFAITWDGVMSPCLLFPRELLGAYPLRDGFDAAWQTIHQGVRDFAVPQKCRTCAIKTYCQYCPVQHGKCALKHECDESVCTYWHKLYEKGLKK